MLSYHPEREKKVRKYVKPKPIVSDVVLEDFVDEGELISGLEAEKYTQDFKVCVYQRRADVPLQFRQQQRDAQEEEKGPDSADQSMQGSDVDDQAQRRLQQNTGQANMQHIMRSTMN